MPCSPRYDLMMEEVQAHHTMKSQAPSLDRLEPCKERLAHDEERLDFKRRAFSP